MTRAGLREKGGKVRTKKVRYFFLCVLAGLVCSAGCGRDTGPLSRAGADRQNRVILKAFHDRRSDLWVTGKGVIERVLPDDLKGTPHQRFILRLPSGHTLLIAHNTRIAPRVPDPRSGEEVFFRGEYEWNPEGGVVHWTHHDPAFKKEGGWIEYKGLRYE